MSILKRVCEETPAPIRDTNPEVPPSLVEVIEKLHAKDPAQRFQSAREVADLLEQELARLQHPAGSQLSATPLAAPPARKVSRRRAVAAAMLVLALAAALALTEGLGITRLLATVARPSSPPGIPSEKVEPRGSPSVTAAIDATSAASAAPESWTVLFNARDLAGWKHHPQNQGEWRVVDGVLTGTGPTSMLYSQRGDYEDFHLRAEARITNGGDAGILFRVPWSEDRALFSGGYQAEISGRGGPTGTIYLQRPWTQLAGAALGPPLPGEWFLMEVIAIGNGLEVRIDGKTRAKLDHPDATFPRGHIVLEVSHPAHIEFRKLEIREFTPRLPARTKPFVILGRQAVPERNFATLAEAVLAAADGDTIEIRGNGPFVIAPIDFGDKALVIRAAPGYRPVIASRYEAPMITHLLNTRASLVLEGLEFDWVVSGERNASPCLVHVAPPAPLFVAHCRIVASGRTNVLASRGNCAVRNCEILHRANHAVEWIPVRNGKLIVDGCTIAGRGVNLVLGYQGAAIEPGSIEFTRNSYTQDSIAGGPPIVLARWSNVGPADQPLSLHVADNVMSSKRFMILTDRPDVGELSPAAAEAFVKSCSRLRTRVTSTARAATCSCTGRIKTAGSLCRWIGLWRTWGAGKSSGVTTALTRS
jgi:hypothetical protein